MAAGSVTVIAVLPRTLKLSRTEPLKALVIGAVVCGLSMHDVESSRAGRAGPVKLPKSTASRMCEELRERFATFQRRDLYDLRPIARFLDATFVAMRPDGPKEGPVVLAVDWHFG